MRKEKTRTKQVTTVSGGGLAAMLGARDDAAPPGESLLSSMLGESTLDPDVQVRASA